MNGYDNIDYLLSQKDKILTLKNMKSRIAVLPGDGIGPEVMNEALKS